MKMEKSNSFLLVYGSETGQAQSIAEQIAEKSSEFGLDARLYCLDQTAKKFNIEDETCMVMVTSTTGDGDAPDNAAKFLRKIKKKTLASDYLSKLHYTVLGLGDTNYNNFCRCGRDMDSRLEQLGATRFYPTGLADDAVGLEIVCEPWLEGLYPALKKHLEKSNSKQTLEDCMSQTLNEIRLSDKQPSGRIVTNGDLGSHSDSNEWQTPVVLISDKLESVPNTVDSSAKITNGINLNNSNVFSESSLNGTYEKKSSDTAVQGNDSVVNSGDAKAVNSDISSNSSTGPSSQVVTPNGVGLECLSISDAVDNTRTAPLTEGITSPSDTVEINKCDISGVLRDSCPSLAHKNLTVPLLAPEFLQAEFSSETVEIASLSFQNGCKLPSAVSDIVEATVTVSTVLTHPNALKKTLLLRLNLKEQDAVQYSPGDSISIICHNSEDEVQLLLERLKVTQELADQQMHLTLIPETKKRRAAVPPHIHPVTTLRYVLRTCVNIRDVPSKALLRTLVEYTGDETEKRRLQELCSKEGAEEYTRCVREKGVSLLDFLYAFPSCQPPVHRILEFLPRLLPRPYSICSCQETNPNKLDIVFNVIDIPRDIVDGGHYYSRRGVCTGMLDDVTSSLQESGHVEDGAPVQISMFFRNNQHFQPPSDLAKPMILVGPGTGVAPFIGFLQQRALLKSKAGEGDKYGDTWLFTGCRHKDKDYLFRDDLEEFEASGVLSRLCVSFSRDADSSHRYVQDYMRAEATSLATLLVEEEALVYVCGDAKNMSKDVCSAFQEILVKVKGFTTDEASAYMMKKRLHKTYFEDVWT